jgi:hypothetical protein
MGFIDEADTSVSVELTAIRELSQGASARADALADLPADALGWDVALARAGVLVAAGLPAAARALLRERLGALENEDPELSAGMARVGGLVRSASLLSRLEEGAQARGWREAVATLWARAEPGVLEATLDEASPSGDRTEGPGSDPGSRNDPSLGGPR